MWLIHNERVKLTATALNGVAIATMIAGFVAPAIAISYGVSGASGGAVLIAIGLVWFVTAVGLHVIARAVLRSLKE